MTADPDLTGRFESELGHGPAPTPPEVALRSGRIARRRRRAALAGAAAAAVVVVAGSVAVGLQVRDGADRSAVDPATSRTPDPAPTTASPPVAQPRAGEDVDLTADGTVLTAPGVRITRTVENPYGTVLPDRSVGLEYTRAGTTVWTLLTYLAGDDERPGRTHRTSDPAGTAFDTLDDWLLSFSAIDGDAPDESGSAPNDFVRFEGDTGSALVARPGVTVLDQSDSLDLPAAIAGPDDVTAVAEVRRQGERWFVLARRQPGCPAEYVAVPADGLFGSTLADFAATDLEKFLPIYPTGDEPIGALG